MMEMNRDVMVDLEEWSKLITELSRKEVKLFSLKDEYNVKSEMIVETTDFKELYGKNNADVRKRHIRQELDYEYTCIKDLELSVNYIKRRISFLKQLIHTKTVLLEVKEWK